MKNARLRRTTLGYLRSTEVTRPDARWNCHDHLIVHVQRSDTGPAIAYVLKERLGTGEGSLRHLLTDAARGDAEAHDDWSEWDAWRRAHPRARFRSTWVAPILTTLPEEKTPTPPRDQSATAVPVRDLAIMALLDAMGATTNAQHELMLGMSRRSIQRRRAYLPDARPGLIPFRVTRS